MTYRETLPPSCPPQLATAPSSTVLWRLLKAGTVVSSDFDSAAFKNPNKNFEDQCGAHGISLIPDLDYCKMVVKSPRMRHFKFAVHITYDASAGAWHQDGAQHVNWWIFKSCDPLELVGKIESLT